MHTTLKMQIKKSLSKNRKQNHTKNKNQQIYEGLYTGSPPPAHDWFLRIRHNKLKATSPLLALP